MKVNSKPRASRMPLIPLDPDSRIPLHEQLFESLRGSITTGSLPAGSQLASTRALASELAVSRFTVVTAVDRLLAEGYLTSRRGSGTFVAQLLPEYSLRPAPNSATGTRSRPSSTQPAKNPRMSRRGEALSQVVITGPRADRDETRPFHPRRPALDQFPVALWASLVRQHWKASRRQHLDYGEPAGYWPLRKAIAEHIGVARGLRCTPNQVIVTSGAQQAFDILFRLLLDPGDQAWIEEPGYLDVRAALLAAGASLTPVPVDREGIDVIEGVRRSGNARLAVVSPSHQYPTGVTMSAPRRRLLLDWARTSGSWIVEDDYDSYFRYTGRPLSTLHRLDADTAAEDIDRRVLYVGTFSKTMFPALRLGFCVVPEALAANVANARAVADRNSPIADQAVMTAFLVEGHYDRHLRRARLLYRERYEAMREAARRHLRGLLTIEPAAAGTHVVAWLDAKFSVGSPSLAIRIAHAAEKDDLVIFPLSRYCIAPPSRDGLILGYGGLTPSQIVSGAKRLARVIERTASST